MDDVKINDLDAIGSVAGSTQFETDTGGTTSNKATASQIKTFVENGIVISNSTGDLAQSRITNLVSDLAAKASLTGSETLTNKTVNLASNTLSGTTAQFNAALSDNDFATLAGVETLTNKTINLTSNTLTGTTAQFNAALSDNDFATLAGTETLTNKTLNNPAIANISGNVAVAGTLSASNLSGTNTGDNAVNSLYSGLVSNATHTGDATGATALTLATVNSNVGSFTSANITVNAKGLITAASNGGQNSFSTIAVSGQSDVVADATADTLTLVAGSGMLITTNAGTDTITLATTGGGGGGEANTASNVNVGGVGVFKQKTGVDLEFRGVNAGSNKVSATLDAANNEIDIDINEANFTLLIKSDIAPISGSDKVNNIISLSQAEYDGATKDANTLYLIV